MKEEILDIAKKLYRNHLTPEIATNLTLHLFDVRQLLIDFCEIYAEGQFEDPDDTEGIVDWYLKVKDN